MIRRYLRIFISHVRLIYVVNFHKSFIIGKSPVIGRGCFISKKNRLKIGNNFYMGNYCHLSSNCIIGDNVLFASFVSLVGGDHKIDHTHALIRDSGTDILKTINIEDNVWIGHGSIIMHGVKICTGAVVAAGSVVTKNIPQNEIWGGNPAKFIRKREFNETNHTRP